MRLWNAVWLIVLGISSASAQSAYQSPHPEDVAGRWEAADGNGGAVGMNIVMTTTVASSVVDLASAQQAPEDFEIAIYQRSGSEVQTLGFNFFSTSPNAGATWDGRYLRIHSRQEAELPEVHVDLAWNDADKTWTGSFERAAFKNEAITLRRPTASASSPFVGTWYERNASMNNCVHIAQGADGTLTGWGDDLQIPGRMRYANGLHAPDQTMEHYGEIAKVKLLEPKRVEVELWAYTAMCCSHTFIAAISPDGNSLLGAWPAGMNQAARPAKWTRVQGDSCVAATGQP